MRVMRSEHDGQGRTKRFAPQTSPHVFLTCILPGISNRKRNRERTLYTSEVFDSISYKHQDDLLVLFSGTSKSNFDRHWRDFDRSLFSFSLSCARVSQVLCAWIGCSTMAWLVFLLCYPLCVFSYNIEAFSHFVIITKYARTDIIIEHMIDLHLNENSKWFCLMFFVTGVYCVLLWVVVILRANVRQCVNVCIAFLFACVRRSLGRY